MKSKCLCVLAIDTSGSMLSNHRNLELSRLDLVNLALEKFVDKIKKNVILTDKLEICIVEIKSQITVIVEPTTVKDIELKHLY